MTSKRKSEVELLEIEDSESDSDIEEITASNTASSKIEKSSKRSKNEGEELEDSNKVNMDGEKNKSNCSFGAKCFRKNPTHFEEKAHPLLNLTLFHKNLLKNHLYLSRVNDVPNQEHINNIYSVSVKDILAMNEDDFVQSAQFNYMIDLDWLLSQYPSHNRSKPLMIIDGGKNDYGNAKSLTHIQFVKAKLESAYGTHHTKMMFLLYKTGLRVVIHTGNLIDFDWHQKTEGVWISNLFPPCDPKTRPDLTDSRTKFKQYLISYLENYKEAKLSEWIDIIKRHDMKQANVYLVGSIPSRASSQSKVWGHLRLRKILGDKLKLNKEDNADKIVCQFSSIGSLGPDETNWLCKEFTASLTSSYENNCSGKLIKPICIYPTLENVRASYEGFMAGGSLPYSKQTDDKQKYFRNFLYKWSANCTNRSKASPHIKSYARYSHDFKKLYWFLLTSANLSKAAWGKFEKNESQFYMMSYEIGVLFLPEMFDDDDAKNYFDLSGSDKTGQFLIPYDLPPIKYDEKDKPWVTEYLVQYMRQNMT